MPAQSSDRPEQPKAAPPTQNKMPSLKTILVISVIAIVSTTLWQKFSPIKF